MNGNKQETGEVESPAPSSAPVSPGAPVAGNPKAGPGGPQSDRAAAGNHDLTAELKQRLEESRLPANLKEQILAELPPPEERERLFRELQEKSGLSSEQFFASLGL